MSILHEMDGGEISLAIDIDQGARISSLEFRGIECVLPFRGEVLTWGWYSMGPWAGQYMGSPLLGHGKKLALVTSQLIFLNHI
jgi:aldose 1-epimerase